MQITESGLLKPEVQEINIESYGKNVTIMDEHLRDTDVHVNAKEIAKIEEPDELSQIDSTDTNRTMWGKIKKSISEIQTHEDKVASETTLGHIKIGTGLQMVGDAANVKITNDLTTNDTEIALSAAMGKSLNDSKAPINHASTLTTYGLGNTTNYGHVRLSDNYTSSAGAAAEGMGSSSKAVVDAYNALNADLNKVGIVNMATNNDENNYLKTTDIKTTSNAILNTGKLTLQAGKYIITGRINVGKNPGNVKVAFGISDSHMPADFMSCYVGLDEEAVYNNTAILDINADNTKIYMNCTIANDNINVHGLEFHALKVSVH